MFYTDNSEVNSYWRADKVNLLFASESFTIYPSEKVSLEGNSYSPKTAFEGEVNSKIFRSILIVISWSNENSRKFKEFF